MSHVVLTSFTLDNMMKTKLIIVLFICRLILFIFCFYSWVEDTNKYKHHYIWK